MITFRDRHDAGRRLGAELERLLGGQPDLIVLGLPRGGVPVAFEVAQALGAPLDVILVRKLGVPYQPELAMGAIGEGGTAVYNDDVLRHAGVGPDELESVRLRESAELDRRAGRFRGDRPPIVLTNRVALLVDDGFATGATARAACQVARARGARRVIIAAPVGARDTVHALEQVADEVACLDVVEPGFFFGVGQFYADFAQTSDGEVVRLLAQRREQTAANTDPTIEVDVGDAMLTGDLALPGAATGLVVFAHGSGSSRFSPRNRFVAERLNDVGLGTLLVDLLTPEEELDRRFVFDIPLLAGRLHAVARQVRDRAAWIGYFGASTGAAAALSAAAEPDADIAAVVSRGGRPDLAMGRLARVQAPTLLVVGGHDELVLDLNRQAQQELHCPNELTVVPGATHLFEEPGALERVADLAGRWFVDHAPAALAAP